MEEKGHRYQIGPDLTIHRIANGMWQVAGGHGYIDHELAFDDMMKYHEAGFTTWDLADIYGPAEDFIGLFRRRLSEIKGKEELDRIQALTKWVPQPGRITYSIVKENIQKSLNRMCVDSLDLLQFHWWDYNNPSYMDALKYLSDLREEGLIKHIGLTNFDTERMQLMMDSGLQIVSNQIQYSIIDRRPEVKMMSFCQEHNIRLLAYGSLCGGLMSERYLRRTQEPAVAELDTLSLRKYKKMIDIWGGWSLFQELLSTLNEIAQKHNVSIANIATRYILEKPAVAGSIIGVRLGISDHRINNAQVFNFSLGKSDYDVIDTICAKSNNLFDIVGDCGDEYR
ncbi:aldo/keto reductase [Candidatus Nitrosocosmicus arcticus]|uniref:Putative aldo/keto reductase n=1 Tax=Candidatus Nitrosocosmicus arcticus TaxID=2035267 RepID=A0A557SZ41_9ARCH|nr:aldo/keto reductase [Candidatus Nitrosocosmicus arcticus]TVP41869.1 putative aldo/keto reductase [Candidatus Nitrosocosmicus arcticus]